MSRYNSKREKKRGTEKVRILDLTGSIMTRAFVFLSLLSIWEFQILMQELYKFSRAEN